MKQKIAIVLIIFFVVLIVVLVAFYPTEKSEKQLTNKEIIEQISDGYISGISRNELKQLMNQDIDEKTMMTGKDAYLLSTPKEEIVEQYKLENYIKRNEQYYKNLESQIKNNYEWKFNGSAENNQTEYVVSIKTYNYGIYLQDLEQLQNLLLNDNQTTGNEKIANEYKAKVVAMQLLNTHLNEYVNNSEEKTILITFTNLNNDETKNSLMQYLVDLAGYNYHTIENINIMVQNRNERLQKYIDDAINTGILNKNDILKIEE